ncbi:MAG: ECF transporter S component [Spirochaetales bacterium]|nr:ECF transporter S component [Spirochaetales bacterium]
MADQRLRKIVISGVLGAVAIVLGITRLGFVPWIGGAALTVMHVPVIIGAIIEGPVVGMIIGFIFGLFSMIQSAVAPTGPIDVAFTNPVISVVPRVLIGLTTWLVYKSFRGKKEGAAVILASVIGSLTNTVLVLGFLGLFGFIGWALIGTITLTNGLPEAAAAAVLSTAAVLGWKKIALGRQSSRLPEIEDTDAAGN